jgi:hypothetical protein
MADPSIPIYFAYGATTDVASGGTGKTSVTTNALLYGAGTSPLNEITPAANSVIVTDGSSVPSLSATLPSAVQSNITSTGTITSGTWEGTAINTSYIASSLTGKTLSTVTINNPTLTGLAGITAPTEIAAINSSQIVTRSVNTFVGCFKPNEGGTGEVSFTDGQLMIGNSSGNTLTKATMTAGSGISITNGNGSITVAATGTSSYTRKFLSNAELSQTDPGASTFVTVFPSGNGSLTFGANTLNVGDTILVEIYGEYSTGASATNAQIKVLFSLVDSTSTAVSIGTSKNNLPFLIKGAFTVIAWDAIAGTFWYECHPTATTVAHTHSLAVPASNFNTTVSNTLDIQFAFSSAQAANNITVRSAIVTVISA